MCKLYLHEHTHGRIKKYVFMSVVSKFVFVCFVSVWYECVYVMVTSYGVTKTSWHRLEISGVLRLT